MDADRHPEATHTVRADRKAWLDEQIARLCKRAGRLGLEAPRVAVLAERVRIVRDEDTGIKHNVPVLDVRLDGTEVVLAGWHLVAAIESDEVGINVRTVPGLECPPEFRTVSLTRCDHCHAARERSAVFVVRHEDGTYKVIGRTCLRDFLGGNDPERLLACADWAITIGDLLDEEEGGGGRGHAYPVALDEFLTWTCAIAREHGFVTRKAAEITNATPTSTWVSIRLWGRRTESTAALFDLVPTDADKARAAEIIAWAGALTGDSDYVYNLRQIAEAGIVPIRRCGIAASAYAGHARDSEERAKKAARKPSEHVGAIGKRAVYQVAVEGVYSFEGNFGTTTIVRMRTPEDNVLVWFASNGGLERGWQGQIKATVKKHDERRGELQTVVTRVTAIETEG